MSLLRNEDAHVVDRINKIFSVMFPSVGFQQNCNVGKKKYA